jgi:MFS family permease
VIFFATGIGGGLGPIIGGLIYDKFGSYVFAWQLGLITLFVASVLILTIKPKK